MFLSTRYICPFILMLGSPLPAWALCCPGDANVIKYAETGIGQPQPFATDLSGDSRWRVHAFERDTVAYLQVSDAAGELVFIVGNSGNQFWLLPAGPADTLINLPSSDSVTAPVVGATEVYRADHFRLLVRGAGGVPVWWVENVPATR